MLSRSFKVIQVARKMGSASLKVTGGKLIKCRVETIDGRIVSIQLTGDFFLHPEDVIFRIESSLKGREASENEINSTINNVLTTCDAELIGASANDFTKVIMEASG